MSVERYKKLDSFDYRMSLEAINDPLTLICKTGTLTRNSQLKELNHYDEVFQNFFKQRGIETLYDIYFDGYEDFNSVSYSELFSIGFVVLPCNDKMRYKLASDAYEDDYPSLTEEEVSHIVDQTKDKYRLTKYRGPELERVIFMPGSNLIENVVDMNQVREEVKKGAYIKPHPLTSNIFLKSFREEFGEDVVLSHRVRGQDILNNSSYISVTSNSEMGLKALMMNKEIKIIDKKDNINFRPIFKQLYLAAFNNQDNDPPRKALLKILGSPKSCVLWKWENTDKLKSIYKEMRSKYAALSHTSN